MALLSLSLFVADIGNYLFPLSYYNTTGYETKFFYSDSLVDSRHNEKCFSDVFHGIIH